MKPKYLIAPLLTSMFLAGAPIAHAASGIWTQTTTGGLWSAPGNWSGGTVAEGSGSTANFNTLDLTTDNTVKMDAPHTLTSLVFGDTVAATAAGWTLDNNGNAANILTLAGTPTLTVNALGTAKLATISAIIDGSSGVAKEGAGQIMLSGTNTYTGITSINAGIVQTTKATALGASGGGNGTTIGASGQLNLSTGSNGMTEELTINGVSQFSNQGALRFTNSGQAYAGALTLGSNSRISGANASAMTGTIDLAAFNLSTFMNSGTHAWSAPISGTGSLTVANVAASVLTLSGTNTYTGVTTVTTGILQFAKRASLYNATPASWTDTNLVVESGATLAFNVGGTDEFDAADFGSLAALGTVSGGFKTGSRIGISTASGNLTYSGVITNPDGGSNILGFTKLGANILTLEGSNTYTGPTTVSAGTLQLAGNTGSVLDDATTVTLAGATLDLNDQTDTVTSLIVSGTNTFTDTANGLGVLATTNSSATNGIAPGVLSGGILNFQGGALTNPNYFINNGIINMNGGTLAVTNEFLNGFNNVGATVTVNGGLIDNIGTLSFGNNACTYRFNGGIARTSQLKRRATGAVDLFFNGGTLKAHSSGNPTLLANFLGGLTAGQNAWVSTGGLVLDTDGVNITIGAALQHDSLGEAADGGVTKSGAGTLTLGGYTRAAGTSSGSAVVTMIDTGAILVGQSISGTGIPAYARITAITPNVSVTLSANATATGAITATLGGSTYNGTTTISGGALVIGVPSTASGTTLLTGATGVGNVILKNGVTLGQSGHLWYADTVTLQGDVTLSGNSRQQVGFKTLDLDGGTRTLMMTPTGGNIKQTITGDTALEGTGRSRWEMLDISDAHPTVPNVGTLTVQNGTLALATNLTGDDYAGFMFQFPSIFAGNAGVIVGPNVYFQTSVTGALGTTTDSTQTAKLTVNGIWNLGSSVGTGHTVYSLAGSGRVYASMNAANPNSRTVTLNGTAGSTDFSGTLNNGPGTGTLSIIKTGASTQILSGANTYTGDTTVTGGILGVTGSSIANANKLVIDGGKVDLTGAETVGTLFFGAVQQSPGTYSATGAGGTIASSNFTGAGTLVVTSGPGAGFASWIATPAFGLAPADQDPADDPDHDGPTNLMEYALGGNPNVNDVAAIAPSGEKSGSNYIFTFKRSDLSEADTTQTVEYGDDLLVWGSYSIGASPGVSPVVIQEDIPSAALDTVTITIPTAGATKFFARLKVVK